jgi:predicted O-methyltransferase YrrM
MLDSHTFDVIYVDGDHTEEGIRRDVEDYLSLLADGGYMVIDDYEVDAHPGVTAYVRGELLKRTDLRLVASGFRNAVFQKVEG